MKILFNQYNYSIEELNELQTLLPEQDFENSDLDSVEDLEQEIQDIDETELNSDIDETITANQQDLTEDNRVLDTCIALNNLAETIVLNKQKISVETISLVNNLCVSGTDIHPNQFIAIENINHEDLSTALEGIGERISSAITNVAQGIVNLFKTFIPMAKSFFTLFTLKRKKLGDLRNVISKLSNETLDFTVKHSRYMVYGEKSKTIESIEEYIEQMQKTKDLVSSINDATIKYTKTRFLSKTITFFSHFVPGVSYDQNFLNLYNSLLNELLEPLAKVTNKKSTGKYNDASFTEYKSDIVLGSWQLKVKIADIYKPKNKEELSDAVKKTIGVVPLNTVDFNREFKVFSSGSVINLKSTKEQLLQIIDQSLDLVKEVEKHININIKWNLFYSAEITKVLHASFDRSALPYYLISQLSSSIRLVRLGSYLTSTMVGSCYSACNGLLNNNIRIIESALK